MFSLSLEYDVACCFYLDRFLIKFSHCAFFFQMETSCSLPYYALKPILKYFMMMLLKIVIGCQNFEIIICYNIIFYYNVYFNMLHCP